MTVKAVVSFPRMSEDVQSYFYNSLSEVDVEVIAVLTADSNSAGKLKPDANIYAWGVGRKNKTWSEFFDIEYFNIIACKTRASLLPLVDRYGTPGLGSFDAELKLAEAFSRAQEIIENNRPDIILFMKEPENPIENFLYLIAKDKGIKTLFTRTGLFPYMRGLSQSWDTPMVTDEWKPHPDVIPLNNKFSLPDKVSDLTEKELTNILAKGDDYIPIMESINRDDLSWHKFFINCIRQAKRPKYFVSSLLYRNHGPIFKYQLLREYRKHQTSTDLSSGGIKVYFPLHLQPEISTMPRGGDFSNQLKAIKILSDSLPVNARIWVKDHPTTFSQHTPVTINFRSKNFYRELCSMPKVELRPIEEPSPKLQAKCDMVSTVTGTAGLESMIKGKPVILFGNATYENGPGVFRVKSHRDVFRLVEKFQAGGDLMSDQGDAGEFIHSIEKNCNHRGAFYSLNREIKKEEVRKFSVDTVLMGIREFLHG